jgi:hypothetical protein
LGKLHLCLICGRDNRFNFIRHTVSQALPVFDAIHIMDTGSTDRTHELASQSSGINYFHWDRWEHGWGDAYDCVRQDVPAGEWFVYLDSDELPSQYMLDHILESVARIEREGYGQARIPNVLHVDGKRLGPPAWKLPRTPEEFVGSECWTKPIICRNGPWLEVENFGMHASYLNTEQPMVYLPLYYCHHKHRAQIDASIAMCSFLMPESYSIPPDSEEHRVLRRLAEQFAIRSPNQLVDLLENDPPHAFVDVVADWEHYPLETCRHWHAWYRSGFAVGGYPLLLCNESCCTYREAVSQSTAPGTRGEAVIDAASVPRIPEGWALKQDGDSVRLVGAKGAVIRCNSAAAAVLSRIDGTHCIADIVYEFAEAFPEAAADVCPSARGFGSGITTGCSRTGTTSAAAWTSLKISYGGPGHTTSGAGR